MSAAEDMHIAMMAASTSYRLQHSGVVIDGVVPLDFARYPFVTEILDEHSPETTILKGGQMGLSIMCIMRALEEAKTEDLRGIGYFFPTEGEVSDFAKARFGPMMSDNPALWGSLVQDTDSASLKRVGNTHLYFRGAGQRGTTAANKSKSKQKSIPLDRIYFDEFDEMDPLSTDALFRRLDASLSPEWVVLSTPTLPGFGVDLAYKSSDQRVWMWRCEACNEWTCLELTYPECIEQPNGKDPFFRCSAKRCHKPLARERGQWVQRKDNVPHHRGFWVSQLSSPTRTALGVLTELEKAISTGRRREFENQILARAYAEADEEITAEQLNALVDPELERPLRHEGPCAMGVDPGKPNWYVVKDRLTEKDCRTLAMGKTTTYEELGRIAKAFNVECGVMDKGYDPSAVSKFCDDHPGWFGCLYVGGRISDPDWNYNTKTVNVGRTLTLDRARNYILNSNVTYARKSHFWDEHFVPQMTNLKRATIPNAITGDRRAEWIVTGGQKNDHLRHADAYACLALEKTGLNKSVRRAQQRNREQGSPSPRRRSRTGMTL
jgi:hypothetical protein